MAITQIDRGLPEEIRDTFQQSREFTETWQILFDAAGEDNAWEASEDPRIPKPGDRHPTIPGVVVKRRSIRNAVRNDYVKYIARLEYGSLTNDQGQIQCVDSGDDIFDEPPQIRSGTRKQQVTTSRDADNAPFKTSAGEPLIDAATVNVFTFFIWYAINTAAPPREFSPLIGGVNDADWFGFPQGTVLFSDMQTESRYQPGNTLEEGCRDRLYWRTAFVVDIRYDPDDPDFNWMVNLIDQGFFYLVGGEPTRIKDNGGFPVRGPQLLDGAGNILPDANPAVMTPDSPYTVIREKDLSLLPIDGTWF